MGKRTESVMVEQTIFICDFCNIRMYDFNGDVSQDCKIYSPEINSDADIEHVFIIHVHCKDEAIYRYLDGHTAKKETKP